MNHTFPELDVIAAFRRQLAEIPEPSPRTRRAPVIAAAAVVAAVPLGAVIAGTDASPEALAISRTATTLELRLADATADPGELTRELNEAGIPGRVLVIPVATSSAGTWVVTAEVAGKRAKCIPAAETPSTETRPAEETVRLNDIENLSTVLRIPVARVRESSGSFLLVAGREARAGERAVDLGSPEAVQRQVFEPVLGSPPTRLPPCA